MKSPLKLLVVSAFALLISMPAAYAQTPEYSRLPVTEPLQVGSMVLQPGDYLIRVMPSFSDRNKVQILNAADRSVITTVLTVPHPLGPGEEMPSAMFVFYPAAEGQPRALRTWFAQYPEASQGGHDVVYDESRAKQLARIANSRVVAYQADADLDTAPLTYITPQATVETYTYVPPPAPAPVRIAESRPMEMPRTASRIPLVALLGLIALAGAVTFRFVRAS